MVRNMCQEKLKFIDRVPEFFFKTLRVKGMECDYSFRPETSYSVMNITPIVSIIYDKKKIAIRLEK